jgi:tRNA nucleotidyltransferase (CCA-adding enzyme)
MAILFRLKEEQRVEALLRLSVSSKVRDFVLEGIHSAKSVVRQMPFGEPALVFDALSSLPLEVVLFAMSLAREPEKKKEFSRYLLEWRHMKPILRGKDLIEMGLKPGPLFSTLLKGILRERLRGNIKTRQDEESFIREFISKNPT